MYLYRIVQGCLSLEGCINPECLGHRYRDSGSIVTAAGCSQETDIHRDLIFSVTGRYYHDFKLLIFIG